MILGGSLLCAFGLGLFVLLIRARVGVVVCVHWGSLLCESFYIVSWDYGGGWLCSLGLGLFVVLIRVRVRAVVCVQLGSFVVRIILHGLMGLGGELVVLIRVRVVRSAHSG